MCYICIGFLYCLKAKTLVVQCRWHIPWFHDCCIYTVNVLYLCCICTIFVLYWYCFVFSDCFCRSWYLGIFLGFMHSCSPRDGCWADNISSYYHWCTPIHYFFTFPDIALLCFQIISAPSATAPLFTIFLYFLALYCIALYCIVLLCFQIISTPTIAVLHSELGCISVLFLFNKAPCCIVILSCIESKLIVQTALFYALFNLQITSALPLACKFAW